MLLIIKLCFFLQFLRMFAEIMNENETLTNKLIEISQKAAKKILKIYNSDFDIEYKDDQSPVTIADKISEEIIMEEISKIEPGVDIISEEMYSSEKTSASTDFFFLIDPLDGTREFIRKNDEFTINIALINRDKPILGVINVPVSNHTYFSANARNSFKVDSHSNIKEIYTNKNTEIKTILYSRGNPSVKIKKIMQKLRIENIIHCGSALKFCLLSEGFADVYIRHDPCYEWDTAAGHAILQGAGGYLYDLEFNNLKYNKNDKNYLNEDGFIALASDANKELFNQNDL